jgi:transposase
VRAMTGGSPRGPGSRQRPRACCKSRAWDRLPPPSSWRWGNAQAFHHGRQLAAWLGGVPKRPATGGKPVVGRSTKRGKVSLRTLLIHGARAVLQGTAKRTDAKSRGVAAVRQRRGDNVAPVALAAQPARIVWALLARGQDSQPAA